LQPPGTNQESTSSLSINTNYLAKVEEVNNAWSDALVGPRPVVEFFKIYWLHLQQNINREQAGKKQFIG
jgi:hypothetical protein